MIEDLITYLDESNSNYDNDKILSQIRKIFNVCELYVTNMHIHNKFESMTSCTITDNTNGNNQLLYNRINFKEITTLVLPGSNANTFYLIKPEDPNIAIILGELSDNTLFANTNISKAFNEFYPVYNKVYLTLNRNFKLKNQIRLLISFTFLHLITTRQTFSTV